MRKRRFFPLISLVVAVSALIAVGWVIRSRETAVAPPASAAQQSGAAPLALLGGKIMVTDVESASRQFIDYYHTVHLTPAQETIKKAALEPMPASCCADSNAYTCCCPCNLSKTIWGLSNYAIAEHGADAKQVRQSVDAWLGYVNPNGSHGDACHKGRCSSIFYADGCGGMHEDDLAI